MRGSAGGSEAVAVVHRLVLWAVGAQQAVAYMWVAGCERGGGSEAAVVHCLVL